MNLQHAVSFVLVCLVGWLKKVSFQINFDFDLANQFKDAIIIGQNYRIKG